jgi:hypothetical protein
MWNDTAQLIWDSYKHMVISFPVRRPIGDSGLVDVRVEKEFLDLDKAQLSSSNIMKSKLIMNYCLLKQKANLQILKSLKLRKKKT